MRTFASIVAAAVTAAALAGSALALDYGTAQSSDAMRASKLIGTAVVNNANERIGEIDDVVMGMNGAASHAVIGVGGFLGIGEKAVAVSFGDMKVTRDNDGNLTAKVNATKDELNKAPTYVFADQKKTN